MTRHHIFTATIALIGLASGLTGGCDCLTETVRNPYHCFVAAGDATCADRFGPDKPFCIVPDTTSCGLDADAPYGCVAELPPDACYSPCGDELDVIDNPSCLESAEGGEAETGTGTGGDETGGEALCGNGVVEGEEECDDGNPVEDDACTNMCTLPVCGDGIVQADNDEACDDGNDEVGDGCTPACVASGTQIWSDVLNLGGCTPRELARGDDGSLYVTACSGQNSRVLGFSAGGTMLWNQAAIGTHIAADPSKPGFAIVGAVADAGQTRYYDGDGEYVWSTNLTNPEAAARGVAFDGLGKVVTVGTGAALDEGFIRRHAIDGEPLGALIEWPANGLFEVVANSAGRTWMLTGEDSVTSLSSTYTFMWDAPSEPDHSLEVLALGDDGMVFAAGSVGPDEEAIGLYAFDSTGALTWYETHDHPGVLELAHGLAPLPNGGVLLVGYTNYYPDELGTDALLSWYDDEGKLSHELIIDGEDEPDADVLTDVVITGEDSAVAVGYRISMQLDPQIWLLEFHL